VFNYEVVLSNGPIVNANRNTHYELFWALKLAGSNYGIITRFDMHTYASPAIWGAVAAYNVSSAPEILTDFVEYSHDGENTKTFKSVVFVQTNGTEIIMTVQTQKDGLALPPMTLAPPISHIEKVGSTHDVVNDVIAAALESTARTSWYTITTKVDANFFSDIYRKGAELFQPLNQREGFTLFVGEQAFQKSFIEGAAQSPIYKALKQSKDDLICMDSLFFQIHRKLCSVPDIYRF
jgi:hypothetical protein